MALPALVVTDDANTLFGQLLALLGVRLGVARDHGQQPRANRVQGLGSAHAVRGRVGTPGVQLLLQAGNADLEELVEVAGEDGQEARPVEQRIALVDRLDERFEQAVRILLDCRGRAIVTGMGKSGIICRKIAATLSSTGTPAFFLHPAEAIHGDLGVITLGLEGYRASLSGRPAPVIDGFTGDQRVFLGWGQVWRTLFRDEALRQQLVGDSHSPGMIRAIAPLRNLDAWYEAFGIKPGDRQYLAPEDRVRIW